MHLMSHLKAFHCLQQSHLSKKLKSTAWSCNIVMDYTRWMWVLSTTMGHPATWNNKSQATFDKFVMGLETGE